MPIRSTDAGALPQYKWKQNLWGWHSGSCYLESFLMTVWCSPAQWCVGSRHTNRKTENGPAHRGKVCAPGFFGPWSTYCYHNLTQASSKCFQTQTFGSLANVSDEHLPVREVYPQSSFFLCSFSSLQVPRSILTAHQPQALAPQVALHCQVGKQHCPMTLATTDIRKNCFLRGGVEQLVNWESGFLIYLV